MYRVAGEVGLLNGNVNVNVNLNQEKRKKKREKRWERQAFTDYSALLDYAEISQPSGTVRSKEAGATNSQQKKRDHG